MTAWTWEAIEALHRDAPALAGLLPWRWVEDSTIHVLADGSVGLAWRLPLLAALAPAQREPMARALDGLVARLPAGTAFSLTVLARPGAGPILGEWARAAAEPHPLLSAITGARRALLNGDGARRSPGLAPRQVTAVLTLRSWPARRRGSWLRRVVFWGSPLAPVQDAHRAWGQVTEGLGQLRQLVEAQLARTGVTPAALDGPGLLATVWPLVNPGHPEPPPRWHPRVPLHQQATATPIVFRPDGFRVETAGGPLEGRVLAVLSLPPETWPGVLTLPATPGSAGLLDLPGWTWLTVAGSVLEQEQALRQLRWKRALAFQRRLTLLGDVSVEHRRIKDELDQLLDRAFTGAERVCQAAMLLVCLDQPAALPALVERAQAAFSQADLRMVAETQITLPSWLASLPFGYDPAVERVWRRSRRLLSGNLADLLPVYGGFHGTGTPTQLLLTRPGVVVPFDPFDADTAPHVLVTGATGSGKSFFMTDLILQQLRRGAAVWVVDKGESYRRLAEVLGGQFLRLSPDAPVTLNPCAGPGDADHQAFLLRLLGEMASGGDARFALTREEVGILGQAITRAFADRRARELTLSDVAAGLEAPETRDDRVGRRLVRQLFPFLAGGPYGRLFDGPNAFVSDARLTVVELGELAEHPDLRAVATMALMHAIRVFASQLPIGQRKVIAIDEAWSLLASAESAAALATAARTYRKLNAAAVFITQHLADFEGPHGEAVRVNCPTRVLLRQEPDALPVLAGLLGLSPYQLEALRSVHAVKRAFSEALVVTDRGSGVVRILVDPLTYWIATSDPADRARWAEAVTAAGGDRQAALQALAKDGAHG